jgi:hypothetical protein
LINQEILLRLAVWLLSMRQRGTFVKPLRPVSTDKRRH